MDLTAPEALQMIEGAAFRIRGGSRFDGRDSVSDGPGVLFNGL